MTQVEDIRHLVEDTLARFGRIDIVVSNAGIDCEAPVVDLDIDLLDRCLAVNVRAPLLLCKFALPSMLDQRSGSIFCITSGAARAYRPGRVGYSMSKAALERMFLSLAEEVRPHNIAVNVLSPGRVDTFNPYISFFFHDLTVGSNVGTVDLPSLWDQRIRDGLCGPVR